MNETRGPCKHFENSNEVYIKIRKTAEEKVVSVLSDKKILLKLALFSLTESIRKDPDKYSPIIYLLQHQRQIIIARTITIYITGLHRCAFR